MSAHAKTKRFCAEAREGKIREFIEKLILFLIFKRDFISKEIIYSGIIIHLIRVHHMCPSPIFVDDFLVDENSAKKFSWEIVNYYND